jgi:GAF domain-containing protein
MIQKLADLLPVLARAGQPDTIFRAIDEAARETVGHVLFTLLYVDGEDVARVYSNRPEEYPVSGRKPMGPTPWGDLVLKRRQNYLGRDKEGIRWAFFDHALIESMGLGSVINVPVVYDDACIGTMNLLDKEYHYRAEHVPLVERFAPLLIPAFLEARRGSN